MTINLSQKEKTLLQDQQKHEEICIQKYTSYANQAQDPQLQQLFNNLAQQEQQHLNTVNQLLAGQVPNMQAQSMQQGQHGQQYANYNQGQAQMNLNNSKMNLSNSNDTALCNDLLMTEKYVSGTYDTAIFEMQDTNVRQALNHIQKEEQQHGESIFNYMKSHGMYNPQ